MRAMGPDVDALPIGGRVVVRHRLAEPDAVGHTLTDVVGDLSARDDLALVVLTRRGEVRVARDSIEAVKALPPRAARRGAAHRALSVEGMQEVMVGAWGALEREWLGRWQLRAGRGYTQRANSVALLGDPGLPLAEAVAAARGWYAVRSLPLNVTLAGPVGFDVARDPVGALLLDGGARAAERCLTMTADAAAVVAAAGAAQLPGSFAVEVGEELTEEWLRAHRGYRDSDRATASGTGEDSWWATARAVLTGSPAQLFASIRDGEGGIVALGRGGLTPGWVGLASIWVDPGHRRQGLGQVVTRALLSESLTRGHALAHLQVLSHNAPAQQLYRALGFDPHHEYVNVVEGATS
jgi:ribosomal protein S18 acetylase RimI-like enzyme